MNWGTEAYRLRETNKWWTAQTLQKHLKMLSVWIAYKRGGSIGSNCEGNNVRVITEKKMLGEAKILTYSSCKDAYKALICDMHVLLNAWLFMRYDITIMLFTIVFPFVQGVTVFYWRIWQNVLVACKAHNCCQFVETHFSQIIKQFISPLWKCNVQLIIFLWRKRLPSSVEQMQFGKKYTLIGGLFLLLFHARLFF